MKVIDINRKTFGSKGSKCRSGRCKTLSHLESSYHLRDLFDFVVEVVEGGSKRFKFFDGVCTPRNGPLRTVISRTIAVKTDLFLLLR